MCLHNIRHGLPSFDLIHPCLGCYDGSDERMIRFTLIANPSQLRTIRALPEDYWLFNTQVVQVELAGVDLNKCSDFLNVFRTIFMVTSIR